ncbi:ABC transporter permease [Desulfobacterales bacterium HSG2]|nr:ABC transporter permease [Desulfobacterales bacterium HSG2]
MKTFFMIGWRNLWRNKRRSLVVITSIALGIFAMLFSMGIMNGMNNQMVENTISTSLGHISIHRKGFQDDMKLQNSFVPSEEIQGALADFPTHAPRLKLEGMIRSSEASRGVLIMGIEPENEKSVTKIFDYTLGENAWLSDSGSHDILISKTLAEKLDLLVGDKVVVMFQDIEKEMVGVAFKVKGLYQSPIDSFDKYVVFTGIDALQELTGMGERISEITVHTGHRKKVDTAAERIRKSVSDPGIEILTWKDMAPNLLSAVQLFDNMMYVFFSIIFITVIFSIANTLIMAIMERFHEIGVMKSIGTRPSWIAAMVLFEAVNLGFVGLLAGSVSGMIVTFLFSVNGIDFSLYMESVRLWGTGHIIYPALKPADIIACSLIVLVTTIIAALYPAIKAARIKPLEALHYM